MTTDGVELPIVDTTHPAFALSVSEEEQRALIERYMKEGQPFAKLPSFLRLALLRVFLRGSVLARGIQRSQGTFMSGMSTYLLKLGPENLGSAYAKPIDRRVAESLPALGVRLRLQDMARLMADLLSPALREHPRTPLHLFNIAGGPAMDSLNTLLVLRREHPELLTNRAIRVNVLDTDRDGPAFGERALRELQSEGAPLHGLEIAFRHIPYDWRHVASLKPVLEATRADEAVAIASSEGGLFEYGSDEEIVANLAGLRAGGPPGFAVVGSVTRDDALVERLRRAGHAAIRPRGIDVFRRLAERAGWRVARVIERPMCDDVALTRL